MGNGYSILIWDDFGGGLVKINARLFVDGTDLYGNPRNWFPNSDNLTDKEIIEKHDIIKQFVGYKIVRD